MLLAVASPAVSQTAEQFFTGKQMNFIVGVTPGGGYDLYARLLARHYSHYMPGNPTIIVRNMPGAGSLTAVLHLDSIAPTDGTTITTFNAGLLNDSMSEGANAKAKFNQFAWLGSITRDFRVCYAWKGSKIETWDELVKRKGTIFGASGPNSNSANGVAMLRNIFKLDLRTISAYPGNTEMNLAVERGEVEGSCISWSSIPEDWIVNKKINVLARLSPATVPEIPPSVKFLGDLATTQEQKDVIEVLLASGELGRPFILSKKVPADRLELLRKAFDATMLDKAFLADAAKQSLTVDPVSGAQAEKIVDRLYSFSPEMIEKAKNIIKE
jgi:tripartite-type tricarboxylate transporter receptor subunit TctC